MTGLLSAILHDTRGQMADDSMLLYLCTLVVLVAVAVIIARGTDPQWISPRPGSLTLLESMLAHPGPTLLLGLGSFAVAAAIWLVRDTVSGSSPQDGGGRE